MALEILDYSKIPLSALKEPAQNILSASLNQLKILPNKDGLPRDWRGLAHLIGLNGVETNWVASNANPCIALLNFWKKNGNLLLLKEYLEILDRHDVIDDTRQLFESNSLDYLEQLKKINSCNPNISLESDKLILTSDDVIRLKSGMEPQIYDAYILYAEEDGNFAAEIVETMESKYNLKLCVRDRDLIGGVQFEHDAIAKLIAERCRRLVVIVSPNFLKSKANKFFVTFAQALGIDIRERKVIPILYKKCDIPPELSYYFFLDYNRAGKLWNFWEKLRDSIQGPELLNEKNSIIKPVPLQTQNEIWITRMQFEAKFDKPESSSVTEEPSLKSTVKTSTKKTKVYCLLKNSFRKAVNKSSAETDKSIPKKADSLEANLNSFASFDDLDSEKSENFTNSEQEVKIKNKKMKRKWFKKKSLETLLS